MVSGANTPQWPGWETKRLIGRGSFGAVYEIHRQIITGDLEKAALKVISIPQNDSDIDELYMEGYNEDDVTNTFQNHLKSIVAEYTLMRKLNGCTNIVSCDDIRYVQHDDGIGWDIFIKMELLTPLAKALPSDIPEEMVVKIAKDMCKALELCKKHEIVHRDVKPQNIFVSDNGDYKLGDFGIAKTVEKTMGGTKIGTYKFMAPEVYNNQPYGTAADIYSLGLVLYWLLNERRMPFVPLPPAKLVTSMEEQARTRRFSGEHLPPPAHGGESLKRIVLKACAYNPADRYQDASTMLAELNSLSGGVAPAAPHVHSYSAVVTPPTCMIKGYTTYSCECGHSYQGDETPALGHSFSSWITNRQATEETEGEERRVCSCCGHAETRVVPKLIKVITPPEEHKKKKPIIPIIAGVAAAAVAAVLLLPGLSGEKEPTESNPSMQGQTSTPKDTKSVPLTITSTEPETTIHQYTVHVEDCSWTEAFCRADEKGGYLAHIDSQEELEYIIELLESINYENKRFYLGGRRDLGANTYYWVNQNNQTYGSPLNDQSGWMSKIWMDAEPSFISNGTEEYCVVMTHNAAFGWCWNDIAENLIALDSVYSGCIAYIVEYESDEMMTESNPVN